MTAGTSRDDRDTTFTKGNTPVTSKAYCRNLLLDRGEYATCNIEPCFTPEIRDFSCRIFVEALTFHRSMASILTPVTANMRYSRKRLRNLLMTIIALILSTIRSEFHA